MYIFFSNPVYCLQLSLDKAVGYKDFSQSFGEPQRVVLREPLPGDQLPEGGERSVLESVDGCVMFYFSFELWGGVVDQWIKLRTLIHEFPSSNLLAAAVVPLDKALYLHCLVPQNGLKAIGLLVACLQAACFRIGQIKLIQLCN